MRGPNKKEELSKCGAWNRVNPVGTEVTLERDNGQIEHTKTRSEAYVCSAGYAVIFLEKVSGYYMLNRVTKKQTVSIAGHCPTCSSPSKTQHPATQFEGEVSLCRDPWHEPNAAEIEAGHRLTVPTL